jgi:hypothetical protein
MARDYRSEYDNYHSTTKQKRRRAGRNTARRRVLKGRKSRLDVDHVDRNPMNNSRKNLRLSTRKRNRGWRKQG